MASRKMARASGERAGARGPCSAQEATRLLRGELRPAADNEDRAAAAGGTDAARAGPAARTRAYLRLLRLPQRLAAEFGAQIGQAAVEDLVDPACHADVAFAALLAMRKATPEAVLGLLLRPQAESAVAALIARQEGVDVLAALTLQAWAALAWPGAVQGLAGVTSADTEEHVAQRCEDAIVECWRGIARAASNGPRHVSAAAFQALETLVDDARFLEVISAAANPFGQLPAYEGREARRRKLMVRTLDRMVPAFELVALRADQFWPSSAGRPPQRSVPSAQRLLPFAGLKNPLVPGDDPHASESPSSGRRGQPVPFGAGEGADDTVDVFDEDTLFEGPEAAGSGPQNDFGGPGEQAAAALGEAFGQSALAVVGALVEHILDKDRNAAAHYESTRKRPASGEALQRMEQLPEVTLETIPGQPTEGYHQACGLALAREWLWFSLVPAVRQTRSVARSLEASRVCLRLATRIPALWEDQPEPLLSVLADALLLNVSLLRKSCSKRDARDLGKVDFYNRALETCVAACESARDLGVRPRRCGVYLCHVLLEIARCPFLSGARGEFFYVALLRRAWTALFALQLPAQDTIALLTDQDPGVLQELLKNHFDSREVRYALCHTLLECVIRRARATVTWVQGAFDFLEVTNTCLTWDHASGKFDVVAAYLDLAQEALGALHGASHENDAWCEQRARGRALVSRLLSSNATFGGFGATQSARLLWLLACHAEALSAAEGSSLLRLLDVELRLRMTGYEHADDQDDGMLFVVLDSFSALGRALPDQVPKILEYLDAALAKASREGAPSFLCSALGDVRATCALVPGDVQTETPSPACLDSAALSLEREHAAQAAAVRNSVKTCQATLTGPQDPVAVTAVVETRPRTRELVLTVWARNRTEQAGPSGGLGLAMATQGPLLWSGEARWAAGRGVLAVGCGERFSTVVRVPVFEGGRDALQGRAVDVGLGPGWQEEGMALQQGLTAAVVSSIAFARKKGSGRSIKAVIKEDDTKARRVGMRPRSVSAMQAAVGANGTSIKRRNSMTSRRMRRARRSSFRSNVGAGGKRSLADSPRASSMKRLVSEWDDAEESATEGDALSRALEVGDQSDPLGLAGLREGVDLAERVLFLTLRVGDVAVPLQPLRLPARLFLQPVAALRGAPLEASAFQSLWQSLSYSRVFRGSHTLLSAKAALTEASRRCEGLTCVLLETEPCCGAAQGAWVANTWSGLTVAFLCTLRATGASWQWRTDARGVWELWDDPGQCEAFSSSLLGSHFVLSDPAALP